MTAAAGWQGCRGLEVVDVPFGGNEDSLMLRRERPVEYWEPWGVIHVGFFWWGGKPAGRVAYGRPAHLVAC